MKNVNKNIVKSASFTALVTFVALTAVLIALSFASCDIGAAGGGEPGVFTLNVGRAVAGGTGGVWNGATIADLYHTVWLFDGAGAQKLRIDDKKNEAITYSVAAGTYEVYIEAWTGTGRTGDLKAIGLALKVAIKSGANNPIPITMRLPFVFEEAPGLSPNGTVATGTELTANAEQNEDDNRAVSFTWQWNRNGEPITGATGSKYKANEAGTYTVTVSARGYESRTSAPVTVAVNLLVLSEDPAIGVSTAVVGTQLTAAYSGGETVTYQWNRDGTPITGATNVNYTPQEEGSYTVTVSAPGYESKTSAAVTVTPKTLAGSITLSASNGYVGAVLTAAYTGSDTTVTYHWFRDGAPIDGVTGTTHTAAEAGTYTVTVRATGYESKTSNVVTISALSTPEASDYTFGNLNQTAGSVSDVTITAKADASPGSITIYYNGSTTIPEAAGTYTVTFNVAAATGWEAATGLSAGTLTVDLGSITISPSPNAVIGAELTAHYAGGTETVAYQWNLAGTPITGATGSTFTTTTAGQHTVTVSAAGFTKTSAAVAVALGTLAGDVTISPNTNVVVNTLLTAHYDGTESVTLTYQWRNNNAAITNATSQTYTPTAAGSYSVAVSATGYNAKTSAAVIVTPLPTVFNVPDSSEWNNVVPQITAGTSGNPNYYIINITGTFSLPGKPSNTFTGGYINVKINGGGNTITLDSNGALLYIANNQTVTIDRLTFEGQGIEDNDPTNTHSLIYIGNGATLNMEGGTVTGNKGVNTNITANAGGGVHVNGTFNMIGGTVTANKAYYGGGVCNLGTFTMSGGEISHNNSTNHGGGVYVYSSGTFDMTGGEVSNNNTAFQGGGIMISSGTVSISNSAEIKDNKANEGGGVFVGTGTTFIMNGGKVSGNESPSSGGGVKTYGIFTMNGDAKVQDNTTGSSGGGVSVEFEGTFNMKGGTVSGNTANSSGGGVYVNNNNASRFYIENGIVYGVNEGTLSNTTATGGVALEKGSNGIAQRGTFNGATWNSAGNLSTTNNTIRVENGVLQ